jgi:hypothetical protein
MSAASQTSTPSTDAMALTQITAFMLAAYPFTRGAKSGAHGLQALCLTPRRLLNERGAELEQPFRSLSQDSEDCVAVGLVQGHDPCATVERALQVVGVGVELG